jgi:uncharacterized protein YacL
MSARPYWVIFTACIIIVVEWLFVLPIAGYRLSDDIVAMKVPYTEGFNMPRPASVEAKITKAEADTGSILDHTCVLKQDLADKGFKFKWNIVYNREPTRGLGVMAAMLAMGVLAGFLIASVTFRHLVKFSNKLGQLSATDKLALFLGVAVGMLLSIILLPLVTSLLGGYRNPIVMPIGFIVITYLVIMAMMSMKEELKFYFPGLAMASAGDKAFQKPKILDTNVIIDGRVADICRTGFIEGQIHIPNFVLEELQHIADSSDSLKRARGRRGLDILNQMRKELSLVITPTNAVDPSNAEEVDARLVKLAQELEGCIVTNDFNLNKVAELQGVQVLNINELANALKPVVLPGEEMSVSIIKEGKEANQGIAYLDDGTMVVVEGARRLIGEGVDVIVTSVLQTVAGKMIFTNLKSAQQEEDDLIDRNVRNYSSFRPRKKTR